jgi:hypothetical protein
VRLFLTPHPLSRSFAVDQIEVEIERPRSDQLMLSFTLTGNIPSIVVPQVSAPIRRTELWKRTCFEAFLRFSTEPQYYEFNFSPSTEWAAYKFDDYRTTMRDAPEIDAIRINWWSAGNSYTLEAGLKIGSMLNLTRATWQIGLSAVIEERSGSRSYWSLVHPTENPDFHHPASFAYELMPLKQK